MGQITTHVLDTAHGRPGAGMAVRLSRLDPAPRLLAETVLNADGRCDAPLLGGERLEAGEYELGFGVGDYFARLGLDLPQPRFLDWVVLRFGIADPAQHYHVPLLVTPWSYGTYRGS
jgi:5-hydroxyisourate hydrolase